MNEPKNAQHSFGGAWTETKLEIVNAYSKSFQTALKHQPFENWYIDPFAGSGDRSEKRLSGGLLAGEILHEDVVTFAGSAKRALQVSPPFDHYRLADAKPAHVEALKQLAAAYPELDVKIWAGDGNVFVERILDATPWNDSRLGWKQRGIVFLDPYGMNVSWRTLKCIAQTERLDVWFLFASKAVRQQLGPSLERVDQGKAEALDRFFGESSWRDEFFRAPKGQIALFGEDTEMAETAANLQAIGSYARKRFQDLFCWVSEPKSLTVGNVPDFFQLYCMTNNKAAQGLISRLHAGVVKAHERASHHMSDR